METQSQRPHKLLPSKKSVICSVKSLNGVYCKNEQHHAVDQEVTFHMRALDSRLQGTSAKICSPIVSRTIQKSAKKLTKISPNKLHATVFIINKIIRRSHKLKWTKKKHRKTPRSRKKWLKRFATTSYIVLSLSDKMFLLDRDILLSI